MCGHTSWAVLSIDLCVQEYVTEADNKTPLKGAHASLKSGLTTMEDLSIANVQILQCGRLFTIF